MEKYTTGTGQKLMVHEQTDECLVHGCPIHNPSNHKMKDWPTHWRHDRGLMERIGPNGIGHPDPDAINFIRRKKGDKVAQLESIHGCDGSCHE